VSGPPHQNGGATSQTTPAWTATAASQASSPGEALLCIDGLATPMEDGMQAFGRGRCTRHRITIAAGLSFGDFPFVLAQAGQQFGEVARSVANVELRPENLVPAVATGAR
jgi:hypothetical protein